MAANLIMTSVVSSKSSDRYDSRKPNGTSDNLSFGLCASCDAPLGLMALETQHSHAEKRRIKIFYVALYCS